MLEFRDVFIMCMLFVHVSRGYVDLPAELPPHMGPPPSECRDLMDLYLVIDGSDSISKPDYQTLKRAIASLIPQIRLGEKQARIGMLVYSSHIPIDSEHPFSADPRYLQHAAMTLRHPRDGTKTALGIEHMRAMFQKYGRQKVPWVALIITDGISKDPEATALQAKLAKEMGISMFAVGITKKINIAELNAIADTDKQVIQLEYFSELQRKLSAMMRTICPCPAPPAVKLAKCSNGPRSIGSKRTYKCEAGYHQQGVGDIVCQDDSTWSPLDLNFACVPCREPDTVEHAFCDGNGYLIGTKRKYRCEKGYALIGNPEIECLAGASWSSINFRCSPCGKTHDIPHAKCGGVGNLIGIRRKYSCDPRYALIGDPFTECLPTGEWSIPQFSCNLCGITHHLEHGSCSGKDHFVGIRREYHCDQGYARIGNPYIECLPSGQWSPLDVECSLCGATPPVQHGMCSGKDHFVGNRREYQCDHGYARIGNPYIECLPSGQWSPLEVECSLCGATPPVQHGMCSGKDHFVGIRREYQCDHGYARIGNPYIECLPSGQWSPLDVECSLCGATPPVQHGMCSGKDHFVGIRREYHCDQGYARIGNPYIECLPSGQWSPLDVECSLCGATPPVQHGMCSGKDHFVGIRREYQCDHGYARIGNPYIECLPSGQWSPLEVECSLCGATPPVQHGMCSGKDHFVGIRREYQCDHGYARIGNPYIECLPSGQWSPLEVECSLCGATPPVQHGMCSGKDHFVGIRREYQCDHGYARIGNPYIECLPSGQWSPLEVECSLCGATPPVQHGMCSGKDHFVGIRREYQCDHGYARIGNPYIECLPSGQWSPLEVECSLCGATPPVQHGMCSGNDHFVGIRREYQCDHGYARIGNPYIECLPSGQWSPLEVECSLCGATPPVQHGMCSGKDHFVGIRREYQCDHGYARIGNPYIECLPSGQWSPLEVECSLCGATPPVQHGMCSGKDHFVGIRREYQCDHGYARIGNPYIECLPSGQWSPLEVECSLCGATPPVQHGMCSGKDHFVGIRREYQCDHGYARIGNPYIECLPSGQWSPLEVECSLCGATPPVQHGMCSGKDHFVGIRREYQCDHGYARIGNPYIECLPSGQWSPLEVECSLCGATPPVQHGMCSGKDHFVGIRREYQCDHGYARIGNPYIECLPSGQWSPLEVECSLCGATPPVQHGMCSGKDHFVGIRREYKCEDGFGMVGADPFIECLSTGEWSKPQITCSRKCMDPPTIENAICGDGGSFFGNKRTYSCINGFIPYGSLETECLADGSWKPVNLICKDCGMPPPIANAYPKLGPNTVGSQKEYYCEVGYIMRGHNKIRCLKTGHWELPNFSCDIVTTPKPTTPPTYPTDPTVCDRCHYENGVGYNNHPYDCNQYIQCYIGRRGLEPVYRRCPFGLFWDQKVLTCRESYLVDCPHDPCSSGDIHGYKLETDPNNCCSFWKCKNRKSVGECCGKWMSYNPSNGSCEADRSCHSSCQYDEFIPGCDKRPVEDETKYAVHVGLGRWLDMPCAPGTAFNPVDCRCSLTLMNIPGKVRQQVCKPTVYLPFNKDFQDESAQHNYVKNDNDSTAIINGAAYFDGNARLMIPRFTNQDFKGDLVIRFRYSEVLDSYTEDQLQSLVSNGDCGTDPSIVIAKIPQYVIMGAKTNKARSMAVATTDRVWKEVVYYHDEQNLEGKVCGASKYISSWGPIQSTPCSLQIGYGQGLHNFVGFIDDFFVYQCRPRHLSSSY